jgi:endonuclease/exonuclease/phosphatase family metal-dependent hydrolase
MKSFLSFAMMLFASLSTMAAEQLPAGTNTFRVMTYNIHHGEGLDGKIDLERIASLIRSNRADIVAVQEVDKGVARTARRDFPAELAKLTGMSCLFSNNFSYQGGEYGNAILSRFPVLAVTNHLLPRVITNESRGVLQATLQLQSGPVLFMATHFGAHRDEADRLASADFVQKLIQSGPALPVILAGDFNAVPSSETIRRLRKVLEDAWSVAGQGEGFSFPVNPPVKRIDYIWYVPRRGLHPVRAQVGYSDASDHLPVWVDFERVAVPVTP